MYALYYFIMLKSSEILWNQIKRLLWLLLIFKFRLNNKDHRVKTKNASGEVPWITYPSSVKQINTDISHVVSSCPWRVYNIAQAKVNSFFRNAQEMHSTKLGG
jgi:hypothetical protein